MPNNGLIELAFYGNLKMRTLIAFFRARVLDSSQIFGLRGTNHVKLGTNL